MRASRVVSARQQPDTGGTVVQSRDSGEWTPEDSLSAEAAMHERSTGGVGSRPADRPSLQPRQLSRRAQAVRDHPLSQQILSMCLKAAYTSSEIATALNVPPRVVRAQAAPLVALGMLVPEAPSRHRGRLVTPYRTVPSALGTQYKQ